MGLGIDEDTFLDVVNSILYENIDRKQFNPTMRGVVNQSILANSGLLNLTEGNLIDPKCMRQVGADVWNALLLRFENVIKILHCQGKFHGPPLVKFLQNTFTIWMRLLLTRTIIRKHNCKQVRSRANISRSNGRR